MTMADRWPVEISLREEDRETTAEARLSRDDGIGMLGHGMARRNPADQEVAEIGEEIAAARALADLAYQLLGEAGRQIEAITHRAARLQM